MDSYNRFIYDTLITHKDNLNEKLKGQYPPRITYDIATCKYILNQLESGLWSFREIDSNG